MDDNFKVTCHGLETCSNVQLAITSWIWQDEILRSQIPSRSQTLVCVPRVIAVYLYIYIYIYTYIHIYQKLRTGGWRRRLVMHFGQIACQAIFTIVGPSWGASWGVYKLFQGPLGPSWGILKRSGCLFGAVWAS